MSNDGMVSVIQDGVRYTFIPAWVEKTLADLPTLRAALGDPATEGDPSNHFSEARVTRRQLYRLLTAVHMPHIFELLQRIEFAYDLGWRDDQFLNTGSRAQLRSGVAEALVVESLLLAGFDVAPIERGQRVTPDIAATRGDFRARVEVYAPRTWEGLFDFVDDAKDWLLHLDEPYDYDFSFEMRHLRLFDERGFARWFDAFEFSLSAQQQLERLIRLAPVLSQARRRLSWQVPSFQIERQDHELDICVTLSVSSVRTAEHELPARHGVLSPPALTGYAPEGILENMLAKGLRKKLERRQAGTQLDRLSVLLVDISHLQVESELEHDVYQRLFRDAFDRWLNPAALPYDLVLFAMPSLRKGEKFTIVFDVCRAGCSAAAREFIADFRA